jgi:predicted Na+-dependent transporter
MMAGYYTNLSFLEPFILPVVVCMIYPSMIGVRYADLAHMHEIKLIALAFVINFGIVPLLAYVLGLVALSSIPGLFAGIAVASLLPTSSMTVTYTVLARGNVEASIKITMASLILGSLLSPCYLYLMVGKFVPIDIVLMLKTLLVIIILPLVMGWVTFKILCMRYSEYYFYLHIKPLLPGVSAWGALFIIFSSIGMKSRSIFDNPEIFCRAIVILFIFYVCNYTLAIAAARYFRLSREDSYTLVYCSALRNLAIAIGLSAAVFGSHAVLMISLAFLIQPVAAAWFYRIAEKKALFG